MFSFLLLLTASQDPGQKAREEIAKQSRNLAAVLVGLGDWLATQKMHAWARREYFRAKEIDPECEAAWKKIGHRKVNGQWELDPSKKLDTENQKKGEEAERLRKEYLQKTEAVGKDFANRFAQIALLAQRSDLESEAKELWLRVLDLDPTHADARGALGYEKLPSGGWARPEEIRLRSELRQGVSQAPKGASLAEEPEYERVLKLPLKKLTSDRFVVAAPHLDTPVLERLIQHAEHTYAMWHTLFAQQDVFRKQKMHLLVLQDREQHVRYVDSFHRGNAEQKEFARKLSGQLGFPVTECYQGSRSNEGIEDWFVHAVSQNLIRMFAVGKKTKSHDPLWLLEGLAYWFTGAVHGSAIWGCVELGGTQAGNKPKVKDARKPETWPRTIRTSVLEEQDPAIRAVILCTNAPDFEPLEVIKAWSLLDFLLVEYRAKLAEFCQDLRRQDDNGEKSFAKVFGWTLDELDVRWKAWVLREYAGR